jgi:drug/metabolite transporter (DMT)-like permease
MPISTSVDEKPRPTKTQNIGAFLGLVGLALIVLGAVYDSDVLRAVSIPVVLAAVAPEISLRVRMARRRGMRVSRIVSHIGARFLLGAALVPAALLVTSEKTLFRALGVTLFTFIAAAALFLWRRRLTDH